MTEASPRLVTACIGWLASRTGLVFLALAGIALLFLIYEHRVHVLGIVPYLVVLACPLMHLFHHRGHGQHRHSTNERSPRER
jgi:hypothetical protein